MKAILLFSACVVSWGCGSGFTSSSGREFEVVSALAWLRQGEVHVLLSPENESCSAFGKPLSKQVMRLDFYGRSAEPVAVLPYRDAVLEGPKAPFVLATHSEVDGALWEAVTGDAALTVNEDAVGGRFEVGLAKPTDSGRSNAPVFTMAGTFLAELCPSSVAPTQTPPAQTSGGSGSCLASSGVSATCTDYAWQQGVAFNLSTSCRAAGGTVASSCSRVGAVGACRTKAADVTITSWFYESMFPNMTATQRRNALASACTGEIIAP